MKAGDLVTISAYGKRLRSLNDQLQQRTSKIRQRLNPDNPWSVKEEQMPRLIGIVTKIAPPRYSWEKDQYCVSWAGEGPPGRSKWQKSFKRSDLKLVNRS